MESTYKEGDLATRLARDQALMLCESPFLGGSLVRANSFSAVLKNGALVDSGVSGKYKNPISAIGKVMTPSAMIISIYSAIRRVYLPSINTHCHPAKPRWPSIVDFIEVIMIPANIPPA